MYNATKVDRNPASNTIYFYLIFVMAGASNIEWINGFFKVSMNDKRYQLTYKLSLNVELI